MAFFLRKIWREEKVLLQIGQGLTRNPESMMRIGAFVGWAPRRSIHKQRKGPQWSKAEKGGDLVNDSYYLREVMTS